MYIDDILIYSSKTLSEHRAYIEKVLNRLRDTGLQLDIDKYKFEVKSIKYFRFIIKADQSIYINFRKITIITK